MIKSEMNGEFHGSAERSTEQADTAKYLQIFVEHRALLESRKDRQSARLEQLKAREQAQSAAYRERTGKEPPPEISTMASVTAERGIRVTESQLAYLRPTSAEDVAYKLRVTEKLASSIQEAMPDGLPLRFHGTKIYFAHDIIESGELSSSVDRLGIQTSFDVADQVSVTIPETVQTTVDYMGLDEERYCLPAGCIFVVLPNSAEDAAAGHSMLMSNVNFQERPNQLFGIMTSDESLPMVREWAVRAGFDPNKVDEFFTFTDKLGALKERFAAGEASPQQYVSYPLRDR